MHIIIQHGLFIHGPLRIHDSLDERARLFLGGEFLNPQPTIYGQGW